MTFVRGEKPRPDWLREHPHAWVAAVAAVCIGAFMSQLDSSIVALTYHQIGAEFDASVSQVQWVSLSYLLVLAVCLIPVGAISDRLGRKRVYLWGFALFGASSVACAVAPTLLTLDILRGVHGGAAAMLQANSVALVATSVPRHRMRTALGYQAAAQAFGLAVGPTIGGVLVDSASWRWVLVINGPMSVIGLVCGRYLLPRTRVSPDQPPRVRITAGVASVLRIPAMPNRLIGALLGYLLLFGPIVLIPAVLQNNGSSALRAGLVVAALAVGFACAAGGADLVVPKTWSARWRSLSGLFVALVGLVWLLIGGSAQHGAGAGVADHGTRNRVVHSSEQHADHGLGVAVQLGACRRNGQHRACPRDRGRHGRHRGSAHLLGQHAAGRPRSARPLLALRPPTLYDSKPLRGTK